MEENFFFHKTSVLPGNQVYLERPRIDALLEKALGCPMVTVTAGAGYGKSQAVYAFVRKHNVRTSWIQFSDGDNIIERFWEKFVDAIAVISRESATQLAEIGFPATERHFSRYLTVPAVDVIPADKYIFVYDDIHLIHNKAVLGFLERSFVTPFPNITSIIISRKEPDIDLSTAESRGQVACITEDELRFNREETAEYFHLLGLRPSTQTVSDIHRDTEGWAFATHLAGLSLKNSKDGSSYVPQALRSNIFKLIEKEIYPAFQTV
jgi:LuxR family maltose regulon positive regulatory protein